MKNLVLTEKPSVARDIAGVLGKFTRREGYLENNDYVITWAIGHLVELAPPDDYKPELKKWRLDTLPILPATFKLRVKSQTAQQYKIVKTLLHRQDVARVVCATDAGREGELIFRYIYNLAGCQKPFLRLWLSETTPAAVQKAFDSLRPGSDYDPLARAAVARSQADWLIGINATRAFTVKHGTLLSVGRVQTPTLALIVQRDREISDFVPTPYWELHATFAKQDGAIYRGKWFKGKRNRFSSPAAASEVADRVTGQPATVVRVEEKELVELPPMLFNLNDLQKEANKRYGLAAAKTLEIAQKLYETKKLLTYPRTDSRHITREMANTLPQRLNTLAAVDAYSSFAVVAQKAKPPGKRYIDDGKVSDHTALLPTTVQPNFAGLSQGERQIYDLVARRFLAIFYPPARYNQTKVVTQCQGETFATTGKVELDPGWKRVYVTNVNRSGAREQDQDEEAAEIPALARGETVQAMETEIREKKTQPPKRYTEASLLAAMEGAGRLLDDQELKEAMRGQGLGTPATRAAIIERLLQVGYIERQRKNLLATAKGINLIELVPELIKSPELTGQWEKTLADIEAGTADHEAFIAGIKKMTTELVNLVRSQTTKKPDPPPGRETFGPCPLCGRAVIEGRKGFGCSGFREGCKFVIWKEIAGKKISAAMVRKLLGQGQTGQLKGFTSRTGRKFNAALVLGPDGQITFKFSGEKQSQGRPGDRRPHNSTIP